MAAKKNTEKSTDKRLKNLKPAWKTGESGNPKGRAVGNRDRRTVIMEALRRIGETKNMTAEEIENEIQVAGIEKSLKGSFFHYQEISNGLYGKITDRVDHTSGGKTLADLISMAHASRSGKHPKATE